MRFYFLYIIIFISFTLCDNNLKNIKNHDFDKHTFSQIEEIENQDAKEAFINLKREFYNEKEKIDQNYERKIKKIKKSKRTEIKNLKERYRNKLKRLKRRYPEMPDLDIGSKPKPKPVHPDGENKVDKKKKKRKDIKKNKKYKE